PAELLDALRSGRARADLDPELVDDDGYPLLSLRAEDALADAEAAYKGEIAAWLAAGGMPDPQWNPEQWRALLLASPVAAELALHAAAHPQAALPDSGAGAPMLQVRAALAGDWSEQQRAAAAGWLAHIAAQAGWPAGRIHAVAAQHSSAAVLAGLAGQGAAGETILAIVLACASRIGEDSVEALARQGALFGAARPQGRMPGEGAAGVLLADAAQAALFGTRGAMLQTTLAPYQDAAGKPDAGPLSRAAAPLLADGATQAGALFADTGHRTARVIELMEFARAATPELDAGTEVLGAGRACGDCGDVPFLAALALAHHHATEAGDAALCVSNEDPLQRVAALIRPAALHS
ncbi:hypothetical protein, partial [Massilia sp. DD77]|uniref:hypothetical protein n=1 Tax=Massilia sp. DD77 TaxID=3109349 RepID=UPI002FFF33CB